MFDGVINKPPSIILKFLAIEIMQFYLLWCLFITFAFTEVSVWLFFYEPGKQNLCFTHFKLLGVLYEIFELEGIWTTFTYLVLITVLWSDYLYLFVDMKRVCKENFKPLSLWAIATEGLLFCLFL